jgi:hypothetical protein
MASDTTAASAQEPELEPSARVHRMSGHRDAIAVVVTCGWSRRILRRQNALARASKVRSAWAEHQREIEAERVAATLR